MKILFRFSNFLAGLLLCISGPLRAGDDMLNYSDYTNPVCGTGTCNNGWQDNGWVPQFAKHKPIHSGTNTKIVVSTADWQAWWLDRDVIDTANDTAIVWGPNVGTSGGQ